MRGKLPFCADRERKTDVEKIFFYDMPIGRVGIAEEDSCLTQVTFRTELPAGAVLEETPLIAQCRQQLDEYFAGGRKDFDLPLCPRGTEFQKKVWSALREIPYGETRAYGEIAAAVGNPKAARAVGMANNRNPISVIVPCHRVIGSDGKLVGYGGGLDKKKFLLDLEREHR